MRNIVALGLLALAACSQSEAQTSDKPQPIMVTAAPVPLNSEDPAQMQVGRLRYLGGLALSSKEERFGGLSGLRFYGERLVAITDAGDWMIFDLRQEHGRLTGVAATAIAAMRGPEGRQISGKANLDAEALEVEADGDLEVAFERDHRVWRYKAIGDGARAVALPEEAWLRDLAGNAGIEAMARIGEAAWLYLAEEQDSDGVNEGVLQVRGSGTGGYGRVRYTPPTGFRPTDAAALDDANILVLSRRYAPLSGVAATIEAVPVDIKQMRLGRGIPIATLAPPLSVDNMEGVAVRREGSRTAIYVVSDDNFSPLQRTLLMKFELLPAGGR